MVARLCVRDTVSSYIKTALGTLLAYAPCQEVGLLAPENWTGEQTLLGQGSQGACRCSYNRLDL